MWRRYLDERNRTWKKTNEWFFYAKKHR
jgi:hypothetical protein